jgi:hypothetical protein
LELGKHRPRAPQPEPQEREQLTLDKGPLARDALDVAP